jgi:hypothetical protein
MVAPHRAEQHSGGSLERASTVKVVFINLLLLAAPPPKYETSPATDRRNCWKCGFAWLPKICAAGKYQWSEQAEYGRANDCEDQCKQYCFDPAMRCCRLGSGLADHSAAPVRPFRIGARQRLKQNALHNTEYRRVRPDAEGECKHGQGGEAGVLRQLAEGDPNVIHKIVAADVRRLWTMTKSE